MKKSSPLIKVSKLSNGVNYTPSLAKLSNKFNELKLNTIKFLINNVYDILPVIYMIILMAGIFHICVGAI
jgi:hypothetical protein